MSEFMHVKVQRSLGTIVPLLIAVTPALSQVTGTCDAPVSQAKLNINNVNATLYPHGGFCCYESYEQPAGSQLSPLFAKNVWFGGLVNGEFRALVGRFSPSDLWTGPVFPGVEAPPNCDDFDRMYSISRTDLLRFEAGGDPSRDLRDWPTGLGAPTIDADGLEIIVTADGLLEHVDSSGTVVFEEVLSFQERLERKIDLGAGERPKMVGDRMIWWVMNDVGNVHVRSGTPPLGMEVHGTAFAFSAPGTMGNVTFHRFRFLYKGSVPIKEAYVSVWLDTDLGFHLDDFVGVDTALGLGYTYNASDDDPVYGPPAPAFGIDFFQGPIANVDGIDNDKDGEADEPGERLQMTSFMRLFNARFASGQQEYEFDPLVPDEFYNVMRGRWVTGAPMTYGGNGFDFSNTVTTFQYPGKPELGEFWSEVNVDGEGTSNIANDRRFTVSSGPFDMDPGDTEEIVYGLIWSRGDDNLDSIRRLREDDLRVQQAYDVDFQIAQPPDGPSVTATALDRRVILEWAYNPFDNNYLDSYRELDPLVPPQIADKYYEFEGYNVYQFSDRLDQEGTIIASYDLENTVGRVLDGEPIPSVTAVGTNNGIQHHHVVDDLTNYRTYHFGIQAYAYNAGSIPKVYASPIVRVEVIPTRSDNSSGGTILRTEEGETVEILYDGARRPNDEISVSVANPVAITGSDYRIGFRSDDGSMVFDITDLQSNEVRFNGSDFLDRHGTTPIRRPGSPGLPKSADGLEFDVAAHLDCNATKFTDPNGRVNNDRGRPIQREVFEGRLDAERKMPAPGTVVRFYSDSLNIEFEGDFNQDGEPDTLRGITEVAGPLGADPCPGGPEEPACVEGERLVDAPFFNSTDEWTMTWLGTPSRQSLPFFAPNTFEIRFKEELDVGWLPFFGVNRVTRVPYEVWDIGDVRPGVENDPSDDVRLVALQFSDAATNQDPRSFCSWGWDEVVSPFRLGYGLSDRIYAWYLHEGESYEDYLADALDSFDDVLSAGDSYTVRTSEYAPERGASEAFQLDQIGIVPNPYRGASAYEVSEQSDEVRFTNMPEQATVRVFDLAGSLIRVLEKTSPESYLRWDLLTDTGLPIGSGVYFIHVEVPDVGEHALKFAVVRKKTQLPLAR